MWWFDSCYFMWWFQLNVCTVVIVKKKKQECNASEPTFIAQNTQNVVPHELQRVPLH